MTFSDAQKQSMGSSETIEPNQPDLASQCQRQMDWRLTDFLLLSLNTNTILVIINEGA